jgi:DNA-directed RNA polymerase
VEKCKTKKQPKKANQNAKKHPKKKAKKTNKSKKNAKTTPKKRKTEKTELDLIRFKISKVLLQLLIIIPSE